ncbi:hypothetical protein JMJ77_0008891 [Colletotrichum scovillei]|uniref:Uncharacterized protein n=1 Tax=Colletotrichum scovillei TaxID=1209932 RepID=A0A9P7UB72_9PEZI|nr:hypothetical protein JMJ78_0001748 [Colletotrichum scovillei]KAG7041187.1 hypothetical protein JMJ77_0008891 [Colletotrichum scovillei]KAG7061219.1 hypothetical protein JMJ76_0010288 [Colletotrichum scovillei]
MVKKLYLHPCVRRHEGLGKIHWKGTCTINAWANTPQHLTLPTYLTLRCSVLCTL